MAIGQTRRVLRRVSFEAATTTVVPMPTKASVTVSTSGASDDRAAVSYGCIGLVTERLVASAARFCGAAIAFPSRVMRRSCRRKRTAERKVRGDPSPPMPAQRTTARSSLRRSFSLAVVCGPAVIPFASLLAFMNYESPITHVGGDCRASSCVTNLVRATSAVSRILSTYVHLVSWSMGPRSISGGRCISCGTVPVLC